jgi:hypothetical protein
MRHGLLYWLLWVAIGATVMLASAVYAVDGGTIPPCHCTIPSGPEPKPIRVYCPIHALEGF